MNGTDLIIHDRLFIDGQWRTPREGHDHCEIVDSHTGKVFARTVCGGRGDVDSAVDAAKRAVGEWASTTPEERADVLRQLSVALSKRSDEIAPLICQEVGTPLKIAERIQVGLPVTVLASYADAIAGFPWEHSVGNSTVYAVSAGVAGAITPWNYPLHQLVAKVGAALAAGCAIVAKPSDAAPLSAFAFAEVVAEVGLAPGLFNLVSGSGGVVGEAIAAHPGIRVISFTGSTQAGARVAELAAANITRVALELGGKSANIVLPDADLNRAVKVGVGNAFLNGGQTCSAWTRMLVPRDQHDEIVERIRAVVETFQLGDPRDPATRMGPLVSANHRESVLTYIRDGIEEGAQLVAGGPDPADGLEDGFYVRPTVFAGVDPSMRIATEEIFGPVLVVIPYDDEIQAIDIANRSDYGLAGGVWSQDVDRALSVARRIRTGQVDINGAAFNPAAPFGGFKKSGIGREFGTHGISEFVEYQSVQR
jgi:acyl-CoA reductase-like NAD-dependent aldehyde dehydrogenase